MILSFLAMRQTATKGMAGKYQIAYGLCIEIRIQTIDHDLNTLNPFHSNFCWV